MALHWPTFFTRLGSAIVFSAIMMVGLLWNDVAFLVLVLLIMVLCLRDYFRLTGKIDGAEQTNAVKSATIATGVFAVILTAIIRSWAFGTSSAVSNEGIGPGEDLLGWLLVGVPGIPILICIGIILLSPFRRTALAAYRRPFHAMLYIVLPCCALLLLRCMHWTLPLVLILCIWMNDTMAYLVGSFIGKTPFSKISPKKTWEGTAGGAILAVVGAAIAAYFIPGQNMAVYIVLSLSAAIAGTAGDLYESRLKRQAGVKDSGTMMPGHGGALDRFDSLLFAAPCGLLCVLILQAIGAVHF